MSSFSVDDLCSVRKCRNRCRGVVSMIYVVCRVSNYVSEIELCVEDIENVSKDSKFECLMCWSMPYFTSSENE